MHVAITTQKRGMFGFDLNTIWIKLDLAFERSVSIFLIQFVVLFSLIKTISFQGRSTGGSSKHGTQHVPQHSTGKPQAIVHPKPTRGNPEHDSNHDDHYPKKQELNREGCAGWVDYDHNYCEIVQYLLLFCHGLKSWGCLANWGEYRSAYWSLTFIHSDSKITWNKQW